MATAKRNVDRAEHERMTKALHDLAMDDTFLDALAEATENPVARNQFKADPKGHLKRKGRDIPDGMTVELNDDQSSWGVRLSMKGKGGVTAAVDFRTGQTGGPEADAKNRQRLRQSTAEIRRCMTSEASLAAVEEALNDPQVREKFKANPKGYLKAKGCDVAEDVDVKISETSNPGWCLILCIPWWIFLICWWECYFWIDIDINTHS